MNSYRGGMILLVTCKGISLRNLQGDFWETPAGLEPATFRLRFGRSSVPSHSGLAVLAVLYPTELRGLWAVRSNSMSGAVCMHTV